MSISSRAIITLFYFVILSLCLRTMLQITAKDKEKAPEPAAEAAETTEESESAADTDASHNDADPDGDDDSITATAPAIGVAAVSITALEDADEQSTAFKVSGLDQQNCSQIVNASSNNTNLIPNSSFQIFAQVSNCALKWTCLSHASSNAQVTLSLDAGTPVTLSLSIESEDDAPDDTSLSVSPIAEDAAIGTVIGALSAQDPDGAGETFT